MSASPPTRLYLASDSNISSANKDQEDLINAYEAEEERITNVLSRKLEQVCSRDSGHKIQSNFLLFALAQGGKD